MGTVAVRIVVVISSSKFSCMLCGGISGVGSGSCVNSGCGGTYFARYFHHYHHHHNHQNHRHHH